VRRCRAAPQKEPDIMTEKLDGELLFEMKVRIPMIADTCSD
jgi:hypothetical protein